jgi:hypothetical protein
VRESLEQRYRRLLGWYPPRYRAIYQEEMVGVLLAAAGPRQTRPGLAEAANLLAGGLRAWARSVFSSPAGRWLHDTGSILALLAPVAVLLTHASTARAGWGPGARVAGPPPEFGPSVWVPLAAWALVVLAALAGLRLAAAVAAWAAALLDVTGWVIMHHRYPQYGWPSWGFALLIGLLAAGGLAPPPQRGDRRWLRHRLAVPGQLGCHPPMAHLHRGNGPWDPVLRLARLRHPAPPARRTATPGGRSRTAISYAGTGRARLRAHARMPVIIRWVLRAPGQWPGRLDRKPRSQAPRQ